MLLPRVETRERELVRLPHGIDADSDNDVTEPLENAKRFRINVDGKQRQARVSSRDVCTSGRQRSQDTLLDGGDRHSIPAGVHAQFHEDT